MPPADTRAVLGRPLQVGVGSKMFSQQQSIAGCQSSQAVDRWVVCARCVADGVPLADWCEYKEVSFHRQVDVLS
jgi:hypothetical protein